MWDKIRKSLRLQLFLSSIAAVVFLLLGIRFLTEGLKFASILMFVPVGAYLICVNFWFIKSVLAPIAKMTDFAGKIAEGSYGIQSDEPTDNEIGVLTSEINSMSEKIAESDKTRTDFVSQVSHELRTPLTAITGWSETIAFDPTLDEDSRKGIQIISSEAERLTSMVTELLDYTRIQDGRFSVNIESVDIAALLEDAIFTYNELFRQAGVTVEYSECDEEIPPIPGDSVRLKQVLLNIFDNAIKHGGDGKKIDALLRYDEEYAIIVIRDYGRGIPEDELPHIKEKFYKGSSKDRGTGIGLAVCDEIISLHDGSLEIDNAVGGGCCVVIRLPVKDKNARQ